MREPRKLLPVPLSRRRRERCGKTLWSKCDQPDSGDDPI